MLKPGDEINLLKIINLAQTIINLLEVADNSVEDMENINISLTLLKKIENSIQGITSSLTYEKNK